jgi:antitoxin component YwqK of YwqJK toxin-antitoxin module
MKKVLLTIAVLVFASYTTSAQEAEIFQNTQGKYVDSDGDLVSGSLTLMYANGKVESTYDIIDGNKDGKLTVFYMSGVTKEVGAFNNGAKNGEWTSYDEKGNIQSVAFYKNDAKHA